MYNLQTCAVKKLVHNHNSLFFVLIYIFNNVKLQLQYVIIDLNILNLINSILIFKNLSLMTAENIKHTYFCWINMPKIVIFPFKSVNPRYRLRNVLLNNLLLMLYFFFIVKLYFKSI